MYVVEYTLVLVAAGAIVTIVDCEITGMRLIMWSCFGMSCLALSFAGFGVIAAYKAEDSLATVTMSLESTVDTISGQLLYFNGEQYFIREPDTAEIRILNTSQVTDLKYKRNGPDLRELFH